MSNIESKPIARSADVANGQMLSVDIGGTEILVTRIDDALYAVANLCTHAEGYLDMGDLRPESFEIECPLHQGRFDLRTGAATALPCVEAIAKYTVIEIDGEVLWSPDPRPTSD